MSSAAPKTVQRTPFKRWCDENTGLFFLIPWILGFLIFKAYPFASSLVYSFTDLNFFKGISQYGLMNPGCDDRFSLLPEGSEPAP